MTFKELSAALSKELGIENEAEGDAFAVRADAANGFSVTVLLHGFDDRGAILMTADLGAPPPERLEPLYRALLEANDLFRDTVGATLSLDPETGHVRLQRFDAIDALAEAGPAKALLAFAQSAADWAAIVRDFRAAPPDDAADGGGIPASGIMV